jgi:uncharacterized protein (UPF0335 family)
MESRIVNLENAFVDIKKDLLSVKSDMSNMGNDIRAIREALAGSELNDEGIIQRQRRLEQRFETHVNDTLNKIQALNDSYNKIKYYVIGGATGGGAVVGGVVNMFL